ncbi:MAG TPA: hypothetical protein VFD64_15445 [Gemmatimonadaceae bacterium]|nr:hypothetical protein [Gemmatimonadaceae bacterium]
MTDDVAAHVCHHLRAAAAIPLLLVLSACTDDQDATGVASTLLDGAEITVSAIDPDTVTVDTIVTVRLTGTGFTEGAIATWLIDAAATTDVRTVSTTWKSPSELEAVVAISPNAPLRDYNVRIRGKKGKQGIAVEKFRIVAKPIPLPEPGGSSTAVDINESGTIVGNGKDAAGSNVAIRWTPVDTGWTYTILEGRGDAIAINDEGLIVRVTFDEFARSWRSWILFPSGGVVDLGAALVRAISDDGTVVGLSFESLSKSSAAVWRRVSTSQWGDPQPLPHQDGYSNIDPVDINARGDIVGSAASAGESFPVIWKYRDDRWQPPERVDHTMPSGARAINDDGAIIGWIRPCIQWLPNCYASPAWWPAPGGPRRVLPTLYNSQASANALNNANQVVGWAPLHYQDVTTPLASFVTHAVIWFPGSELPEDLGAIRPSHVGEALAINNRGWIVGSMNDPYRPAEHATLWKLPAIPTVTSPASRR